MNCKLELTFPVSRFAFRIPYFDLGYFGFRIPVSRFTIPNTYFPLAGLSRKQTVTSHSSVEAEIVAMTCGLRVEGLPALTVKSEKRGDYCTEDGHDKAPWTRT